MGNAAIEQQRYARGFLVMPSEVASSKQLTSAEKLVYSRILGFTEFFESVEATAEYFGISPRTVKSAEHKLEAIGFIRCIANTGRGKRYTANLTCKNCTSGVQKIPQTCKNCTSDVQEIHTYNKEDNKDILLDTKVSNKSDKRSDDSLTESESKPKQYGNAQVNELLDLWRAATGFDHLKAKSERYAISGLIRSNGYDAVKALVLRVGVATRSDDRFAPQIAKPSQLRGKYSKLEALVMWERRQAKIRAEESKQTNPAAKLYRTPEEYTRPQDDDGESVEQKKQIAKGVRERFYKQLNAKRSAE